MKKLALFVLLSFAESLWAQTATLKGVVADESGAVVPNANVVLKGPGGLTSPVVAGDDGSYSFTGMPTDKYTVEAAPLFGQANQPYGVGVLGGTEVSESANNRRLELQARFTF